MLYKSHKPCYLQKLQKPGILLEMICVLCISETYGLQEHALACSVLAHLLSCVTSSTSGAAPPAMRNFLCTRQRTTQRASCRLRSASSSTSLLLPRSRQVAVRPLLWMPITFTTLPLPTCTPAEHNCFWGGLLQHSWKGTAASLMQTPSEQQFHGFCMLADAYACAHASLAALKQSLHMQSTKSSSQ